MEDEKLQCKVPLKPIIGIPVYKDHESFEMMILSLISSTNCFDRIIIVESDGDLEYWKGYGGKGFDIIHTKKEGPLKAYNKLFEIAKQENKDLFITQTDILFPRLYKRDWLEMMSTYAQLNDVGIVTSLNGGGVSGEDYLNGFYWVGGWCTYFSKKCWEVFEKYDENYIKGWGVDIDSTYQINKKYKTLRVNYWVDHHQLNNRSHETNPNASQEMKQAGDYFKKKWGIK